jgi:hypothetical protein
VGAAIRCARCDEPATTVVLGFSDVLAYLDLCPPHLEDLLRGARPAESPLSRARDGIAGSGVTQAPRSRRDDPRVGPWGVLT